MGTAGQAKSGLAACRPCRQSLVACLPAWCQLAQDASCGPSGHLCACLCACRWAFGLTILITIMLAMGTKESQTFNTVVTILHVLVVVVIIIAGFCKADAAK